MLGPQRTNPHGQLVRMILVLAGVLANPVEFFPNRVAVRQQ